MIVLTFATFFIASGFSSLTMGSYPISEVFAQGDASNTANQGISQLNNAANTALCAAGALTGAACNTATIQGNVNSGSNTAGQTAGGGPGSGGVSNTANQAIGQSNSATGGSANQGNVNSGSNTAGQTAVGGTGTGATTQSTYFDAKLTGKNEVPPKDTKATGTATFNIIGTDSISYEVHVKDMQMVTAAHIHQGKAGENGPVLVTLFNAPSAMTNGVLAKGTITGTNLEGPLAGKQVKDLISMIRNGGTYANVHTTANPMGEIRGQIVAGKTGMGATGGGTQ